MTALLVVVVAGLAASGLVGAARRAVPPRRAARTHHRVLDTLDTITRQAGEHPRRGRDAEDAHTHVRLVRGDPARPAGPPARGALRTGRTLGAAPFRAPVARHALDDGTEALSLPAAEEQVRVRRTGPNPTVRAAPAPPAAIPVAPPHSSSVLRFDGDGPPPDPPAEAPPAPEVAHLAPQAVAALATSGRRRLQADVPLRRRQGGARRRRPGTVLVAGASVVVVAAALAVALTGGADRTTRARAARHPPAPAARPPATAAAPSPTTTVPAVTLISSTPHDAVYDLTGPSTITLTASSGTSWIECRQGDRSGAIMYQGSLRQGQVQTVPSPAWVRLGNPTAVTIAVNQTPLSAPSLTAGEPYNLQFR